MLDKQDPRILWVSPNAENGNGSFENPFSSIKQALERCQPGYTIVLKEGIYSGDLTIQISGSAGKPIRISSDLNAKVEIHNACWFLYDTSDLIITGLSFVNSSHGAVSMIGTCRRNRFDSLHFINCGAGPNTSCTFYIGGSGAECNIIENCVFKHSKEGLKERHIPKNASIGLMISEGDADNAQPIKHHIFRKNHFENYNYGILVGSRDSNLNQYGHIVEYNTIENCSSDGILVKCGDTQVRGNLVRNCGHNSITVTAGTDTIIENNRIVDCGTGIQVHGAGHTIVNNCIIRCGEQAIRVCGRSNNEYNPAINLFIENNTFVDCGSRKDALSRIAGILIEPGTTSVIRRNLIYGQGRPYQIADSILGTSEMDLSEVSSPAQFVIDDNIFSGNCDKMHGVNNLNVVFPNIAEDIYDNESGYGASGWMLKPETFDPHIDDVIDGKDYAEVSILEDENGEPIFPGEAERREVFDQFFVESHNMESLLRDEE